ncbi:LysR substrate-binding domain-containing protein [Simiduia litorea]
MFDAMQHFVQVVEAGSFSHAAKRLNKNASSVARQIDKLEQELGTQLFSRTTRRLDLTLHGQSFYHQCLDILNSVDETRQSFKALTSNIEGQVSISSLDSYGDKKIIPLLPLFQKKYPHSKIVVSLDNTMIDLHESPFDLTVRYGRPADSNFIVKPLVRSRGILVASPTYLKNHPAINEPEDLKHHSCLALFKNKQHTYWQFQKAEQTKKLRIEAILSACGGSAVIKWAKQDLGVTLNARWFVEQELASGELVEVLPDWQANISGHEDALVYLMWKATNARRPVVRAMIDFLAAHLVEVN